MPAQIKPGGTAGVSLDPALFPLLVRIQRRGPLGVSELADLVGRDYTTVSQQMAKLESLDLITRRPGNTNRRVTEAVVTEKGQAISELFDAAWPDIVIEVIVWPLAKLETNALTNKLWF